MRTIRLAVAGVLCAVAIGCGGTRSADEPPSPSTVPVEPTTAPMASVTTGSSTTVASSTTASSTSTAVPPCGRPGLPLTVPYTTIAGVDANLTSLDIHPPEASCAAPVVMWVHGGGYTVGDKANQMIDKVRLFNDHGWILVSVNYRLTAPGDPSSAQFPDHFRDVATAVAWVHDHIADYGGDPSRLALLGHSAGADIVSNVATVPTYLSDVGLGLDALSCAGPLDTEGFDKITAGAADPDGEKAQWQQALGNHPDYLDATSATLNVRAGIGIPPMIGVVRGTPRRQSIERAFLDALDAAGIPATRIDARSLTHAEVGRSVGAPGDTTMTPPLVEFLRACLDG